MRNIMVVMGLVAACGGGGEDIPSCQQAFTHFYGAGCMYKDLNSGATIPRDTMIANCIDAASSVPSARCQAALDDFLVCNSSVPSPAMNDADCDCSQEYMAIAQCE